MLSIVASLYHSSKVYLERSFKNQQFTTTRSANSRWRHSATFKITKLRLLLKRCKTGDVKRKSPVSCASHPSLVLLLLVVVLLKSGVLNNNFLKKVSKHLNDILKFFDSIMKFKFRHTNSDLRIFMGIIISFCISYIARAHFALQSNLNTFAYKHFFNITFFNFTNNDYFNKCLNYTLS